MSYTSLKTIDWGSRSVFTRPITFKRDSGDYISVISVSSAKHHLPGNEFLEGQDLSFLSPDDQKRFHSIRHDGRKLEFFLGRYLARNSVMELCSQMVKGNEFGDPASVQFSTGVFKQVVILNIPNIEVSISHSNDVIAAVASQVAHPLGVDIERVDETRSKAIDRYLTDAELSFSLDNHQLKTVLWTAKEAMSKILRVGMMVDFSFLETDVTRFSDTGQLTEGYFRHISQYRFQSFTTSSFVITIVFPKNSVPNTSLDLVFEGGGLRHAGLD